MKKNLIFLTLLISVLMVSFVSAGITGYLVSRGGGIADGGYTARLQKVEGTTAIVSVQTPEGDTKIVRVPEGETAKVGEAEISASSLTRGTLFRRGGADVKIDVVSAAVGGVSGTGGAVSGAHTHLTNFANTNLLNYGNINLGTFLPGQNGVSVGIEISCASPQDAVPVSAGFNLDFKTPSSTDRLPVIQYSYIADKIYYLGFFDPDHIIIPTDSWGYVYCADVEQAIGSGEPHF